MTNFNYTNEAFRGLDWVNIAQEKEVIVVGQGGIGSWLTFLLNNIVSNIYTFDDDTVEERNLSGQLFSISQIGMPKVRAVSNIVSTFYNTNRIVSHNQKFNSNAISLLPRNTSTIFLAVDSIKARTNIIELLLNNVHFNKKLTIIDGRLSAERFQVYTITDGVSDLDGKILTFDESLDKYLTNHCPLDIDLEQESCTTKQTAFWANGVVWAMLKQFTKALSIENNLPMYLPFKIEEDLWT